MIANDNKVLHIECIYFCILKFFSDINKHIPKVINIDRHYKITLLYLLKSHMLLSRAVKPENFFSLIYECFQFFSCLKSSAKHKKLKIISWPEFFRRK